MFRKSMYALALSGLALGLPSVLNPVSAAVAVKAGILTCHVDSGWGFVFGSSRELHCTYSGGGRVEHYAGKITKFGVDIGYLESGVIVWGIIAPTTNLGAGALAGDYGGVTAGASVTMGGQVNALIGGSTKELTLQPVSIEGDKGINVAAGIAGMSLVFQK